MSEERLRELGMPRRAFLKRAAVVFVAPVVVSFGLDGIASAGTSQFPNQFPGQPALQHYPNQAQGPPQGFPPPPWGQ